MRKNKIKKKVLCFDLDGTIIDSSQGVLESVKYALTLANIAILSNERLANTLIGPPLYEGLKKLTDLPDEKIFEIVRLFREHYADRGVYMNTLYDGILESLKSLKVQGATLYIVTSKPQRFAEEIIQQHNLENIFTDILGAGEHDKRSTKASKISEIMRKEGIKPNATIMIGDREDDIIAAKSADIYGIAVLYGFGDRYSLEKSGADAFAKNPKEIINAILSL